MDRPTEKNPLMSALQIYTNFIDSGLITTVMVLFTHVQEQVSKGNVQRTKENFGEETARSTLDPDGEVNTWPCHFESR